MLVTVALLLSGVFAASAQQDPCFLGGFTDETNTACVYRAGIQIDISYPQWVNDHEFARTAVQDFIAQTRDQFWEAGTVDLSMMFNPWFLQISYEEFAFSESVQSILFTISDYTGGAHPNSYFKTFVFDLAREREIALEDLFTSTEDALAIVSPMAQQVVIDRLGDDFVDSQWLEDGTGTNPENYRNFVLMQNSILFLFPPYQLAAYAAGPFEVTVLLDELGGVLTPEFRR
jgi:hypothetical protein